MTFTADELRQNLALRGIPAHGWQLADARYETVADDHLEEVWQAWIDSLRANASELLTTYDLGGGKTRTVPRWKEEAGDCDDHALICFAHALVGNWLGAVRGGAAVGRTFGVAFYHAVARAENRNRAGGHAVLWFINHQGVFRVFEPADGNTQEWLPAEYMSATFGICA